AAARLVLLARQGRQEQALLGHQSHGFAPRRLAGRPGHAGARPPLPTRTRQRPTGRCAANRLPRRLAKDPAPGAGSTTNLHTGTFAAAPAGIHPDVVGEVPAPEATPAAAVRGSNNNRRRSRLPESLVSLPESGTRPSTPQRDRRGEPGSARTSLPESAVSP